MIGFSYKVNKVLNISEHFEVVMMITVGKEKVEAENHEVTENL